MRFHCCFPTTFLHIFATFPGEGVTNTTVYLRNNYPFFPWVPIIILAVYFGLECGLPCVRAQEKAWHVIFLNSFCWLPAVGSIAREEPPWMAPGSSPCMDRGGHLLMFPCLSAPSERSNINPQPPFSSSWSVRWTMQCYIWFTPVSSWALFTWAGSQGQQRSPLYHTEEEAKQRDNKNNLIEMSWLGKYSENLYCIGCYYQQIRPYADMWTKLLNHLKWYGVLPYKSKQNLTLPCVIPFCYSSSILYPLK